MKKLFKIFDLSDIIAIILIIILFGIIMYNINTKERSGVYFRGYRDGIEDSVQVIECIYTTNITQEECIAIGMTHNYLQYVFMEMR